jgi:GT2 family glycosyltransferase
VNHDALADLIAKELRPKSVITSGPDSEPLASALRERSIAVVAGGRADLMVLVGQPSPNGLASADSILCCPVDLRPETLRRFADQGFFPDFRFGRDVAGDQFLLFRRYAGSSAELNEIRREIRALNIALERKNTAIDQQAQRISELATAVDSVIRGLADIVESRIWRSLCAIGGVALSASTLLSGKKDAAPASRQRESTTDYQRWITAFEKRDSDASEIGAEAAVSLITWLEDDPVQSRRNIDSAAAEYVALVEPEDSLAPDAVAHVAALLRQSPEIDLVYSDEDVRHDDGSRQRPFFKPDWSPDLLLSYDYLGGLLVFRKELVRDFGELSGRYDLALRLSESAKSVHHVGRVLYHRTPGTPTGPDRSQRALENHLRRANPGAWVEPGRVSGTWRVRYPIPADARVSIIIPSAGKIEMLAANLRELAAKTDYPHFEVVVVDNSSGGSIEEFVSQRVRDGLPIRRVDWRWKPFNFSAICNAAARECDSPYVLFLNDDTTVIRPDWLRALVELAARPEVGVVGAKLVFPDGSIQHAGVVLGLFGRSGHAFKGLDGAKRHYFDFPDVIRNVSAVTGACMMVRADVFRQAGGFDEENFPVDSNDIDLCLRIGKLGHRVLYTPYAELYHHEAASKPQADKYAHPAEVRAFHDRWKDVIAADPFYNSNLTREAEDYSLRL